MVAAVSGSAQVSGHDFSRAGEPQSSTQALRTAEKRYPEGGGGFNLRIKPTASIPALAAEECFPSISLQNTSCSAASLAPEGNVSNNEPLAVLLLGPTGSGKTALSLALGERFGGEIVSCDSVAVYRGMDLGTAKPTPEERAHLPHHLIDVAEPDQHFTAGEYSRQARAALKEIAGRGRLPIVTGGTGLYLRALTEGLFAGPERQTALRARLERGLARSRARHAEDWLHRLLARLDPASAARIHANDTPKLIRAIEVCLAARKPFSQVLGNKILARDPLTGFRLLRIGLNPPRKALYDRLNQRAAAMFAAGLIEETRSLLARYGPVKALDSLGYRQALRVLRESWPVEEAIAAAQQGHRNYAKRQLTWFRREPDLHWIEGFGDEAHTLLSASELVQSNLI
jgi:tRNA dimethylallyltransferase